MKKINFLVWIPVYGTVILFFWLFVKKIRNEINNKFHFYFIISSLFGFLSFIVVILFLLFLKNIFHMDEFVQQYGFFTTIILGGYLMNLFSFFLLNKKWNDLQK